MADRPRLAVFARLGSRPIPRVVRMARVAAELGLEPLFCGAIRDRELRLDDEWQGLRVVRLGRYFPLLGGLHPLIYLRSVLSYNRNLLRYLRRVRPALVHASDIETMPAAILYRCMDRTRLVYNIHDNVSQRYNVWRGVRVLLNLIEGLCARLADVTVVPEEFRRDALPAWCRKKVVVVRNTPGDIAYDPPAPPVNGRIRIFFGGWLDWGRGLRSLLQLADSDPRIELRVAGEGTTDVVSEIRRHPAVTYLGFLDHDTVLMETRHCHFVPALYDPVRAINRYAASNKVAEALAIGRPLVLNSEMEITKSFAHHSCAVVVPYAQADRAWMQLRWMMDDWSRYEHACEAARRLFEERYAWSPVRAAIVSALAATPD